MKQVVVIGGGASGLVAAIHAARNGACVTVLERMQRVGKKLLATGNGRCNLANRRLDATHYHGAEPRFVEEVFAQFGLEETLAFFERLGVPVREEDDGKLFPASQQASSVLDVLRYEMAESGVVELCDVIVQSIELKCGGLRCVCGNGRTFDADAAVIATGGKSSPNLGSNGGGYRLAQSLGHTLIEPFPALVQVTLASPHLNHLAGVGIEGRAEVWMDGQPGCAAAGELLFAKYGISGTAILRLSRTISESTMEGRDTKLRLDLFPALSREALAGVIQERIEANPRKPVEFSFVGLIHKRLIAALLGAAGFRDVQRPCGELSREEVEQLARVMKAWTFCCTGTQSWMFSQVTAGGVDVREVDPATLESKRAPGVHFAGEVLDVDGDSGGYNLQWAWSSGVVAGMHAASSR